MAVAGRGGKIDSRALGNWLAHTPPIASSISTGEPLAMEAVDTRQGVAVWRLR